jgi:hypothetical protein
MVNGVVKSTRISKAAVLIADPCLFWQVAGNIVNIINWKNKKLII